MSIALTSLHVLSVACFLGNIITGHFWKAHADRSGDPRIIAHTLHGIMRSEWWLTLPSAAVIAVTGYFAARAMGVPIFRTAWLAWGIGLFAFSGIAFAWQVGPLQARMRALAESAATNGGVWDIALYRRLSLRWALWGVLAIAAPIVTLALMIAKPGAP